MAYYIGGKYYESLEDVQDGNSLGDTNLDSFSKSTNGSRSESGKAMSNSTLTQGEKADKAANIISSAGSLLTGASNLIGSITGKGTPSEVNNYYEDDSSKTWIIVGILLVVVLVVVLVIANRK